MHAQPASSTNPADPAANAAQRAATHPLRTRAALVLALSALALCTAMALHLAPGPALAETAPEPAARGTVLSTLAVQDQAAEPLPERFDLRDKGVVSPVKNQLPWGTCWSLATVAASESSILSERGETYQTNPLELSARHLAWFSGTALPDAQAITSLQPHAAYAPQAGEGMIIRSQTENPLAHPLETGGFAIEAASVFACGIGPVAESEAPYRNNENMATYTFNEADEVAALEQGQTLQDFLRSHPGQWRTFAQITGFDEQTHDPILSTPLQGCVEVSPSLAKSNAISSYAIRPIFDSEGRFLPAESVSAASPTYTWGLPEQKRFDRAYELEACHVLPSPTGGYVGQDYRYNEQATQAMKQELLAGRGIVVGVYEDTVDEERDYAKYTNPKTWSQYTVSADGKVHGAGHEVCIVGWDDSWAPEKFSNGTTVTAQPPGPGAWIVKNSYGAEKQGFPNEGAIGYKDEATGLHTGYFYLSYYDMSISNPTTFDFDATGRTSSYINQHDLTPAGQMHAETSEDETACANVFTAQADQAVHALSVEAQYPNTHARLELWRLNSNPSNPTDGEQVAVVERDLPYEGYYRIGLDQACTFAKGQQFAVVARLRATDASGTTLYQVPMHRDVNEAGIAKWGDAVTTYVKSIVNPGESYLLNQGTWTDWAQVQADKQGNGLEPAYDYDNFALKAYANALEPASAREGSQAAAQQQTSSTRPAATAPKTSPTARTGDVLADLPVALAVLALVALAALSARKVLTR